MHRSLKERIKRWYHTKYVYINSIPGIVGILFRLFEGQTARATSRYIPESVIYWLTDCYATLILVIFIHPLV